MSADLSSGPWPSSLIGAGVHFRPDGAPCAFTARRDGTCPQCGCTTADMSAYTGRSVCLEATAPIEGVKLDSGKPRWDLLPFDALEDVGAVLSMGAAKYAPRNWELGMAWGRLLAAALRHLSAWARGQDTDAESGLPHLAHAACCVLMLAALARRKVGTVDRQVTP